MSGSGVFVQCYGEPEPIRFRSSELTAQWNTFLMAFMGETTDVGVAELLSVLARRAHTGRLHINANDEEVQVNLEKGQVVQVSSSHFRSRLGRIMVRMGMISEDDLDRAVRDQAVGHHARPLGQILTERGLVTQGDLSRAAQEQATDALARVFGAKLGTFFFTTDRSEESRSGLASLNAEGIVLEASRRADEVATLRRILPPDDTVLALDRTRIPDSGRLPESEQRVVRIVVRGPATIRSILAQMAEDELAALRSIVSLRNRGILAIKKVTSRITESNAMPVVRPRSVDEIARLMALDPAQTDYPWAPSITDVRASAQAGSLTTAQLTRTVRDVVAAFNSGLPLLAFAHFSDEYFRRMTEMSDEEKEALRDATGPLEEQDHQTFVGLKDARTLGDGRVSAIVITKLPEGPESKKVVIFTIVENVFYIDAIIESALERERHTQTTMLSATGLLVQDNLVLRRHL